MYWAPETTPRSTQGARGEGGVGEPRAVACGKDATSCLAACGKDTTGDPAARGEDATGDAVERGAGAAVCDEVGTRRGPSSS